MLQLFEIKIIIKSVPHNTAIFFVHLLGEVNGGSFHLPPCINPKILLFERYETIKIQR